MFFASFPKPLNSALPETKSMRRDGQFYLIDAFFAAAIVFIGIGFLVSDFVSTPRGDQARVASIDISNLLFETPINDIIIAEVLDNRERYDAFLTPMAQLQVWERHPSLCGVNCDDWGYELIDSIIGDLLPSQHGINITMQTPYGSFSYAPPAPEAETVLLINSRRMLYTIYPDGDGLDELLGPDLVEVRIWV